MHERSRDALALDGRHVAGNALGSGAPSLVVRMLLQSGSARTIRPPGRVAIQANLIRRLAQLRIVLRAVHIVARSARNAVPVHHALRKVVALHPILVRSAVGKEIEGGFTQLAVFQFPEVLQPQANVVADRPIVIFPIDRIRQRLSLGMTLDAGIVTGHAVHFRRIQNVAARGMRHMLAARSVAALTADVPLSDLLGLDVVVDGMASVA